MLSFGSCVQCKCIKPLIDCELEHAKRWCHARQIGLSVTRSDCHVNNLFNNRIIVINRSIDLTVHRYIRDRDVNTIVIVLY